LILLIDFHFYLSLIAIWTYRLRLRSTQSNLLFFSLFLPPFFDCPPKRWKCDHSTLWSYFPLPSVWFSNVPVQQWNPLRSCVSIVAFFSTLNTDVQSINSVIRYVWWYWSDWVIFGCCGLIWGWNLLIWVIVRLHWVFVRVWFSNLFGFIWFIELIGWLDLFCILVLILCYFPFRTIANFRFLITLLFFCISISLLSTFSISIY
jgi:hypothetical protein